MTLAILFFIIYSISIFFISKIEILVLISIFNLCLMIFCKINLKKLLLSIVKSIFFLSLVFVFNLIFDDLISSLCVIWKLFLVLNLSAIYSQKFTNTKIANGISGLLIPLKLFKIDIEAISIIIVIGLNFISILKNDFADLKRTLKVRNIKFNLKSLFTNGHIIFVLFFLRLFKKINEIESTMKARNFVIKD